MEQLMEALDLAANAGTDSLISESDIKQWFAEQAVSMLTPDQQHLLAQSFAAALSNREGSFADVSEPQATEALDSLKPLLTE